MNKPPNGLVQLSALPRETWVGRGIFHPLLQHGDIPIWRDSYWADPNQPHTYSYEVGVVTRFVSHAVLYGTNNEEYEVFFSDPKGATAERHHRSGNCWTLSASLSATPSATPTSVTDR